MHDRSNPRSETNYRVDGKLAVTMLNQSLEFLPNETVVIVDCQTFCPEHIPVLKSLKHQRRSVLPFQKGLLVNIDARTHYKSDLPS